jgi:hypothetical protein
MRQQFRQPIADLAHRARRGKAGNAAALMVCHQVKQRARTWTNSWLLSQTPLCPPPRRRSAFICLKKVCDKLLLLIWFKDVRHLGQQEFMKSLSSGRF